MSPLPRLDAQTQVNMTQTLGLAAVVDILDEHEKAVNEGSNLHLMAAEAALVQNGKIEQLKALLTRTTTTMRNQQEMISEHHIRIKNLEGIVDRLMGVLRQV